jgi:glycosyltransferase involved in cell wall biosynthesis
MSVVLTMISIVIPTYNRAVTLLNTLSAYYKLKQFFFEIVIVDDGSTDNTEELVHSFILNHPDIKIKYLKIANSGPGIARNIGIAEVTTRLVLITGDDIIPSESLLNEHLLTHQRDHYSRSIAVLGKTVWNPSIKITPFMNYIQEYGLQFGYSLIKHNEIVPFNFFYTSNISLNTSCLIQNKFNETFPYAAWEDTELAYRLSQKGLKIIYNENALAYHDHNISLFSFCERQIKCGYSSGIFSELHPELNNFLSITNPLNPESTWKIIQVIVLKHLLSFTDQYFNWISVRDIDMIMNYYYKKGQMMYQEKQ